MLLGGVTRQQEQEEGSYLELLQEYRRAQVWTWKLGGGGKQWSNKCQRDFPVNQIQGKKEVKDDPKICLNEGVNKTAVY